MIPILSYVRLTRPRQYIKNGFIGLPILFGNQFFDAESLLKTGIAFGSFCCLAGAVYVFNDINDAEQDRKHPIKQRRPIASGEVPLTGATVQIAILYRVSPPVVEKHAPNLYVTVFCVICRILRYLQLTFVEQKSGSPTWALLRDRPLRLLILLWLMNVFFYCTVKDQQDAVGEPDIDSCLMNREAKV